MRERPVLTEPESILPSQVVFDDMSTLTHICCKVQDSAAVLEERTCPKFEYTESDDVYQLLLGVVPVDQTRIIGFHELVVQNPSAHVHNRHTSQFIRLALHTPRLGVQGDDLPGEGDDCPSRQQRRSWG